jgi:aspartyl-tRNA(Asn)/glutamyl-tRNA(Gln) amidotransferase subunit A
MPARVRDVRISDIIDKSRTDREIPIKFFQSLSDSIMDGDTETASFRTLITMPSFTKNGKNLIPFSVKDIIDTAGVETSYGSSLFNGNIPSHDAKVVASIKHSGGILQGKTNTHEFAMGIITPQCRNPWDKGRITGGSSGGSAASVAACFSPFSIGTDTAGSIRIPSSFCGVTGLKPTQGLLSLKGIFPEAPSLDTVGPITRFASDIPLILDMMGADITGFDPLKLPARVALIRELFEESENSVRSVVMGFIEKMVSENLIETTEISIPEITEVSLLDDLMDSAENFFIHRERFETNLNSYTGLSQKQLGNSSEIRAHEYMKAQRHRKIWKSRIRNLFRTYDFLLSPTLPEVAPDYSGISNRDPEYFLKFMKYTNPFNFSSTPALSMPCGFSKEMPVGLQICASRLRELPLCDIAMKFQDVSEFHLLAPGHFAGNYNKIIDSLSV